jgi:hypothetical protein
MNGSASAQVWVTLAGSLAVVALILIGLGVMLGIAKPADAFRRIAAIVVLVILAMVIPPVLANAWSAMSLLQRLGIAALALVIWQWRRPRRRSRKTRSD